MNLEEKVKNAPLAPGCYIFRNAEREIIYVGKAKCLRNRVKQYFQKSSREMDKVLVMVRCIRDVEYRITKTERDALLQEYILIKKYRPWFNIQHKTDSKEYGIQITKGGAYEVLRAVEKRGAVKQEVLGSFRTMRKAKEAIQTLHLVWKTAGCNHNFQDPARRACLNYDLKRCVGPCIGAVDKAEYSDKIKDVRRLLQGKNSRQVKVLEKEAKHYAENLEFEKAAACYELLKELHIWQRRGRYLQTSGSREKGLLFLRAYNEKGFSLYGIQKGKVCCRQDFEQELTGAGIEYFVTAMMSGGGLEADDLFVDSLFHIYADKHFAVLPVKVDAQKLERLLRKEYALFSR